MTFDFISTINLRYNNRISFFNFIMTYQIISHAIKCNTNCIFGGSISKTAIL